MHVGPADGGGAAPSPPGASTGGGSNLPTAAPAREFFQQEKKDPGNTADGSRYHFQPAGQLLPGIPSLL